MITTSRLACPFLFVILLASSLCGAKDAKSPKDTLPKVNDRCTTWVANAYYTGRYLGVDNSLSSATQYQDLRCGESFRKNRYPSGFVTIFGGSSVADTSSLYAGTMRFAHDWTLRYGKRFPILTGAGPGVMEAGSRGALAAGGPSIGYTTYYGPARTKKDPSLAFQKYHDSVVIVTDGLILSSIEMREILMINHSAAMVVAPGGTGTEWELFEILDGLKNAQLSPAPVYLIGNKEKNWSTFQALLSDMGKRGTLDTTQVMGLFSYVENPLDVIDSLARRLKLPPPAK